jgi:hypothetical protein
MPNMRFTGDVLRWRLPHSACGMYEVVSDDEEGVLVVRVHAASASMNKQARCVLAAICSAQKGLVFGTSSNA